MTGLDCPFVFECTNCDRETTIIREDARGLYPDPDSFNAVKVVLEQRGWMRSEIEDALFCPNCIRGTSTAEGGSLPLHEFTNPLPKPHSAPCAVSTTSAIFVN